MKGLRINVFETLLVLTLVVAAGASVPCEVFGFRALEAPGDASSCTFAAVFLSEAEEIAAIHDAKSILRNAGRANEQRIDLLLPELPNFFAVPMSPISSRESPPALPLVEAEIPPYSPSCRAASPVRIAPEREEAPPLPFPREELLQLN